jgi:hypothetical protein
VEARARQPQRSASGSHCHVQGTATLRELVGEPGKPVRRFALFVQSLGVAMVPALAIGFSHAFGLFC